MDDEKVKVEIKENGNISVVFVSGELTLLDAPDLKNSLDAILEKGIRRFLFDFENLDFLDSSGISLLLRFHAQLAKLNGKMLRILCIRRYPVTLERLPISKIQMML